MLELLAIWILCGVAAGMVAESRGADYGRLWFFVGVILGPLGVALAFLAGSPKICPYCKKRIHPEANKCAFCQTNLVVAISALPDGSSEDAFYCRRCGRPWLAGGQPCVCGAERPEKAKELG